MLITKQVIQVIQVMQVKILAPIEYYIRHKSK